MYAQRMDVVAWSVRPVSSTQPIASEPDIIWLLPRRDGRTRPTTADVRLLIEVSASSLAGDLREKADLYSESGVSEYWVVDIASRRIHVMSERPVSMRSTLISDFLNSLDTEQSFIELKKCCGSTAWVEKMNDRRPFQHDEDVNNAARCCWNELDRAQRLAAFAAHRRIGTDDVPRCGSIVTPE